MSALARPDLSFKFGNKELCERVCTAALRHESLARSLPRNTCTYVSVVLLEDRIVNAR